MTNGFRRSRRPAARLMGERVRELSLATQNYVEAVARSLKLHRTDVTAVGALVEADRRRESLSPSELARRLNLSAAAVTALLDRLERGEHATRSRHVGDGRMVDLAATDQARTVSRRMFDSLNRDQEAALAGYTDEELALVARVLADLTEATRRSVPDEASDPPV